MERYFNVDGICYPDEHYMIDVRSRIMKMSTLVETGKYFVINRARQYGKTTLLGMLVQELKEKYSVFAISFEGIGDAAYADESTFCRRICGLLYDTIFYEEVYGIPDEIKEECHQMSLEDSGNMDFRVLSNFISKLCKMTNAVLIIDEVDQASNQEIFLSFLGMLRDKYLKRKSRPTFQSIILTGVYDIKNLKLKAKGKEEHQYNSPWNIATQFSVEMNFSAEDIKGMLGEYENEKKTGMNIEEVAETIYGYTSGYPVLVLYICKKIDESKDTGTVFEWNEQGVDEVVKTLLKESNTLFDDMVKHLTEYPELSEMIQNMLFEGQTYQYNTYDKVTNIGTMFGFLAEKEGDVCIANKIFATHMHNDFWNSYQKRWKQAHQKKGMEET